MSVDVLGRVVEVVSGTTLDQFIAGRIAEPLGLSDTGFYVPAAKVGRVAQPQADPMTGMRPPVFDVSRKPSWPSGGGGMVSTASDYARFSQMLLNGGELDGVRVLSPRIVAFITSDQLPPASPSARQRCKFSSRSAWRPPRASARASGLVS